MLKTIKIKSKNELKIPTYDELFRDLSKKKEKENKKKQRPINLSNPTDHYKISKPLSNNSTDKNLTNNKTLSYKKFKENNNNLNIRKSNFKSSRNQNQEANYNNTDFPYKSYKIGFQEQSKKKVIIPDFNSPSRCKIILLFGEEEEYNKLKKERDELINNIKKLEEKIKNANEQLEKINNDIELLSEENLQIIFERKKEQEQHEHDLIEIPKIKEDIENIKNKINDTQNQTKKYKNEMFKIKEEINEINIKIANIKKLIEKQIKENAKIKHELDLQKKKNEELMNEFTGKYGDSFIKDITKLIPPKEKENKTLLNSLQ